ncbi:MAG: nitrogen regulation protein NR(II) [Saezia sp.]
MMMYKMPPCYAGLDLLAAMVVVVRPDAQILYANTALKNVLALSLPSTSTELLKLTDILKDKSLSDLLLSVARQEVSSVQFEDEIICSSDQDELPVHVIITPSHVSGELIVEMFLVELQAKQGREKRLYELSKANKEMIRNLAHEIKNPLGGIRGAAQLLQMEMGSQELIEYTEVIIHEADRLQRLVDRLLEPHRKAQVLEQVNIHEICERVATLILAEFPQGLHIVRDYDISIPEFEGDKSQLIQAVLNIAHNAAGALSERIKKGDAVMEFRTRVTRQAMFYEKHRYKMALELHIIDNGIGVPEEMQERIFYPLVSGKEEGTGLGLTLAQIFIHQHGGLIECVSRPGYTDFKVTLPLFPESKEKK